MLTRALALTLIAGAAFGQEMSLSSATHMECMRVFMNGPAIELHEKMRPLARTEDEWDGLVSVILETFHVACFSLAGVADERERDDQMPWVQPGPVCAGESL